MKKLYVVLLLLLLLPFVSMAQETIDVTLKITYRNNPLCYWDVTIKHGDVALASGKTDDKGVVKFKYVRLLSNGIDAYGKKKTANGDKNWDVKGYITLDNNGSCNFDFENLLKETGMPVSMMEVAWGLTLNDCAGSSANTNTGSNSSSGTTPSTQKKEETTETNSTPAPKSEPLMTPQESLQAQKTQLENRIYTLGKKITKRSDERNEKKPESAEYSELSYDIADLEIEKQIAEKKLEKVNLSISKNYLPLSKAEKGPIDDQIDALNEQQKELKRKQKDKIPFGGTAPVEKKESTPQTTVIENEEEKASGKESEKSKESDKKEDKSEKEEEKVVNKRYTAEEMAAMSTFNLKKLKLDCNAVASKRKLNLKTKNNFLTPAEKTAIQAEIDELTKQVELVEAELAKREKTEEQK